MRKARWFAFVTINNHNITKITINHVNKRNVCSAKTACKFRTLNTRRSRQYENRRETEDAGPMRSFMGNVVPAVDPSQPWETALSGRSRGPLSRPFHEHEGRLPLPRKGVSLVCWEWFIDWLRIIWRLSGNALPSAQLHSDAFLVLKFMGAFV